MNVSPDCDLCAKNAETVLHILIKCPTAASVLNLANISIRFPISGHSNINDILVDYWKTNGKSMLCRLALILWSIWINRNSKIHGAKPVEASFILNRADTSLVEFRNTISALSSQPLQGTPNPGIEASQDIQMMQAPTSWIPPPAGSYKINTDAAISRLSNAVGLGAVIKDSSGQTIAFSIKYMAGNYDSHLAELLAAREGLLFCNFLRLTNIHLKLDAANAVRDITVSTPSPLNDCSLLCDDIRKLGEMINIVSVKHIFRCFNHEAHKLASSALYSCKDL